MSRSACTDRYNIAVIFFSKWVHVAVINHALLCHPFPETVREWKMRRADKGAGAERGGRKIKMAGDTLRPLCTGARRAGRPVRSPVGRYAPRHGDFFRHSGLRACFLTAVRPGKQAAVPCLQDGPDPAVTVHQGADADSRSVSPSGRHFRVGMF